MDLGAHIGYYTLIFAKLVGNKGKVYAFEPNLNRFNLLKKNVGVNRYKNVVLVNKTALNKTGGSELYLGKDEARVLTDSMYKLTNGKKSIVGREIDTIRLDDYFKNRKEKINFIKMDIETSEIDAIRGGINVLNRNPKMKMIVEFLPYWIEKTGRKPEELISILKSLGFKLSDINEKEGKLKRKDYSQILKEYPPKKQDYTNLFYER